MELNKEQMQQAMNYVSNSLQDHRMTCPVCGNKNWEMGNRVFQMTEFYHETIIGAGSIYPVFPLTCQYCGNTILLNAIKMGLVDGNSSNCNSNGE